MNGMHKIETRITNITINIFTYICKVKKKRNAYSSRSNNQNSQSIHTQEWTFEEQEHLYGYQKY